MKKNIFFFLFFSFFFLNQPLWSLSMDDFDKCVDFSLTLEELSNALEKNDYSNIDKTKYVILNGVASVIRPVKPYFYLLNRDDIINVSGFINSLKKTTNKVSQYLLKEFTPELRDKIKEYKAPSGNDENLMEMILKELGKIMRKNSLYSMERFARIPVKDQLRTYAQMQLETEELAFVNRLLMEAAYPAYIKKVAVQLEIIYGVWIGYDEVKSYKSVIKFTGDECFKIFNRNNPQKASSEMISVHTTVLIVAKILDIYTDENGEKGWSLEGYYIRGVQ